MARSSGSGTHEFYAGAGARRTRASALLLAAVAAGTLSTAVQAALWLLFKDDWTAVLYRDARLTAALLLGTSVLPPPASFDFGVMAAATAVHFALSLVYVALLAPVVDGRSAAWATAVGAAFGLALYGVNLHGFTILFPWFAQARDWIAVAAHVAFGVVAALAWQRARRAPDA